MPAIEIMDGGACPLQFALQSLPNCIICLVGVISKDTQTPRAHLDALVRHHLHCDMDRSESPQVPPVETLGTSQVARKVLEREARSPQVAQDGGQAKTKISERARRTIPSRSVDGIGAF